MKRKLLFTATLCLAFFCLLAVMLIFAEQDAGEIRDSVLRFHIVANSDSDEDQQNKLAVRDGIAQLCSELFYTASTKEQAIDTALSNGGLLEARANEILSTLGSDDSVSLSVRKRFFPTRHYDGVSLPAGVYDTVDIRIGSAKGKNFWCVMFPDICIGASDDKTNRDKMASVLSENALEMATERKTASVRFKFKIVEVFENIKNFFSFI